MTSIPIKNNRQKSVGSLKKIMPTITVPTLPIPVHTAYAVPTGMVSTALYISYKLTNKKKKNEAVQLQNSQPAVSFILANEILNPISRRPAMSK